MQPALAEVGGRFVFIAVVVDVRAFEDLYVRLYVLHRLRIPADDIVRRYRVTAESDLLRHAPRTELGAPKSDLDEDRKSRDTIRISSNCLLCP